MTPNMVENSEQNLKPPTRYRGYGYIIYIYIYLVGGFNSSEKYESQLGLLFPIYGKMKNVQNHQPDMIYVRIRPKRP